MMSKVKVKTRTKIKKYSDKPIILNIKLNTDKDNIKINIKNKYMKTDLKNEISVTIVQIPSLKLIFIFIIYSK